MIQSSGRLPEGSQRDAPLTNDGIVMPFCGFNKTMAESPLRHNVFPWVRSGKVLYHAAAGKLRLSSADHPENTVWEIWQVSLYNNHAHSPPFRECPNYGS